MSYEHFGPERPLRDKRISAGARVCRAARVSWKFFDALGIAPAIGRGFRAEEDKAGGDPVVMISDALWQRRFARDAAVIGRTITVDSRDYTIIGVELALSRQCDGSGDVHRGPGPVCGSGVGGELSSGAAGDARGPGDRVEGGVSLALC